MSRSDAPRYLALLRKIALTPLGSSGNDNLQWRRMQMWSGLEKKYGVPELWSARASREMRMLASRDGRDVVILDFVRRNDRSVYGGQREGLYT